MEYLADVRVAAPEPVPRSTKAMPVRLLTGVANARLPEFEPVPVLSGDTSRNGDVQAGDCCAAIGCTDIETEVQGRLAADARGYRDRRAGCGRDGERGTQGIARIRRNHKIGKRRNQDAVQ